MTFFTDDEGVYVLDNRDAPASTERAADGSLKLEEVLNALKQQIRKIQEGRLKLPPEVPYVKPHNTWVVNYPRTLLVISIGDLAQHVLLNLCYMLQNGSNRISIRYKDLSSFVLPTLWREFFHLGR